MNPQPNNTPRLRKGGVLLLLFVAGVTAVIAWARVGILDLPSPPRGVTAASSGLADLPWLAALDRYVRGGVDEADLDTSGIPSWTLAAAWSVREGLAAVEAGDAAGGLAIMAAGVRADPSNLVLGNAYRMTVFRLQRNHLAASHQSGMLVPSFPPFLDDESIRFFSSLVEEAGTHESRLQLALAWVDKMLLFPALEIKAPSSVEAVNMLTAILQENNAYVPALFARGLNHLHRPARLVWPEADKTPLDAAARDIGLCVAIGRRIDVGSKRLQATLAIALGDAYVKAGRLSVARSWWQIAQNLNHDDDLASAVRRRYGWNNEEILDRLEEELDRARQALDHPMTDLAMMWN